MSLLNLGDSISCLLLKYGAFDEVLVIRYFQQILRAVAYIHEHGIIHRDIKGNLRVVTKLDTPKSDYRERTGTEWLVLGLGWS